MGLLKDNACGVELIGNGNGPTFVSFLLCKILRPLLLKKDNDLSFSRPLLGKPIVIISFIYFLS